MAPKKNKKAQPKKSSKKAAKRSSAPKKGIPKKASKKRAPPKSTPSLRTAKPVAPEPLCQCKKRRNKWFCMKDTGDGRLVVCDGPFSSQQDCEEHAVCEG
jgi:hypothetical protein